MYFLVMRSCCCHLCSALDWRVEEVALQVLNNESRILQCQGGGAASGNAVLGSSLERRTNSNIGRSTYIGVQKNS